MPVTVVVGGQFGSEGKGKTTSHLSRYHSYDAVVRCGGPNSGHTITLKGEQVVLRQIPAGIVNGRSKLYLSAGCIIDLEVLFSEIDRFGLSPDRLKIDRNTMLMRREDSEEEIARQMKKNIGSTCSGTGIAVSRRVLRGDEVRLAKDETELAPYVTDVSHELNALHKQNENILVEGTQGFGLSLYHSPYYPYATSRDTTAAGFISEVGLSPFTVSKIVMVLRTFPIRVPGNSGKLLNEINWKTVREESGYPYEIGEYTSVTKNLRRVARFDLEVVKKAVNMNKPSYFALMGSDYIDFSNKSVKNLDDLSERMKAFVQILEIETGTRVGMIGTGPTDSELIEVDKEL